MGDQINIEPAPLVVTPDQAPATAAVHPPTDSFGPGSVADDGGTGDGDRNAGTPDFAGTGDRDGRIDPLAARG